MALERVGQSNGGGQPAPIERRPAAEAAPAPERPAPHAAERMREADRGRAPHAAERMREAERPRTQDRIDVGASQSELMRELRQHRERLERSIQSRRKLIDAVREVLNAGGFDDVGSATRAADGVMRRGAI